MFGWLKELLDLRIEYKRAKLDLVRTKDEVEIEHDVCQSCETLKMQLAIANEEKKTLLNRLLKEPEVKKEVIVQNPRAVIPARHLGFEAKRRALEAESKANARLLEEKRKEESKLKVVTSTDDNGHAEPSTDVADLEAELDIVAAERESQSGAK